MHIKRIHNGPRTQRVATPHFVTDIGKAQPEIERRFFIESIPPNLNRYPHEKITQGYLPSVDGTSIRLRKIKNKYYQTIKIDTERDDERMETEVEIPEKLFERLWPLTKGKRLTKTRYEIPYNGKIIELDVYHKKLDGLVTVEVEFDTEEECKHFKPPAWFGRELTGNKKYTNKSLAIHGIPKNTTLFRL